MKHHLDLMNDNIFSIFIKYLSTSVAGMLMISVYILFDTIFIGRGVGSSGLAALNIALPVYNILFATGLLFGIGGATAFSVSMGRGEYDKAREIFTSSLLFTIGIGIFYSIAGSFFLEKISIYLGASPDIFPLVTDYLGIIMIFAFSFVLVNTLTVFVRNDRGPKLAMLSTVVGGIINIILDAVFIFVFNWGMRGAAVATCISSLISLSIVSLHFLNRDNNLRWIRITIKRNIFKRILENGLPSFVVEISSGFVIFAFNRVLLLYIGEIGVSAYSIIANIALIVVAIFTGIAQAIQPIISTNHGGGMAPRVEGVKRMGIACALVLGILFYVVGVMLPEPIVNLFATGNKELTQITTRGIAIYFTAFILMGVNIVMGGYFQAIELSKKSLVISLCRGVGFIFIGLAIFPRLFFLDGIWITVPFAELMTLVVVIFIMYMKEYKKSI